MTLSAVEILRSQSLPMVLEQEIERVILSGEFAPGDRINEKELALRFGISRGPIREALRSMDSSGLVEQVPNRGFFVRQLSAEQACDVYDVRAALFGLAGKLLAERITEEGIEKLKSFIADMDAAVASDDFESYVKINFEFHEFIVAGGRNASLAQQYLGLVKQLRLYRARSLMHRESMQASHIEHHAMAEAIIARDPARALATHTRHVEAAKERLMATVTDLK
ncbi:transcriptional regulator, GntR family [Rhizobium sp. CF080]|uniref:FCD domain-containing protein n=1 Tax=Rhizobium sp. (strain CF080) TaxID=1144310 RepID=UPI0002716F09|nr:FCD domain-containing protein [Rhizobium sp. CF080]EUB99501.1 transcriptional regulator, GntR family [Rhizobium sp. CF080]